MFDFVTSNKRVVKVVLAIIILPFAFFGIDFYFRDGGGGAAVAEIGDARISGQELSVALRNAQDRMREQARGNAQLTAYLGSPEFRKSVLDDLIQRRLLLNQAVASGMAVSDAELQRTIAGITAFHDESGKFSIARYEQLLRAQNMTPDMFENQMRQEIILSRMQTALGGTAIMSQTVVERLIRIREQERRVSQYAFTPAQFQSQAKVTQEDAKKFYDDNQDQFQIPERVRLEYAILTPEVAASTVKVTDEELREIYQQRIADFQSAEERRASHILFSVPAGASDDEKAKVRAQAESVLDQLKKAPGRFAELAKRHSQDLGSGEQGGDLGYFQRGFMVKPFDDAVFSMEQGAISELIETQYGYHIIRLDGIKPVTTTPFEKVRAELMEQARKDRIQRAYAEAAQTFGDMVYSQYDSLKPAAEALNLTIQQSDWIAKSGGGGNPLLNNERLLELVFSAESIADRRNTEAIEVQPSMLLSARVIEHAPASTVPFEQVSKDIVDHLVLQSAIERAEKEGRATLEKLQKGEKPGLQWSSPQYVSLQQRQGLLPEAAKAVFSADVKSLPAYVGVPAEDGRFVVYRISEVRDVESVKPEQVASTGQQIGQMAAQAQYQDFVTSLRERAKVKINDKALQGSAP
jgi:peptidyl-prolyl cis-trans isomerase D